MGIQSLFFHLKTQTSGLRSSSHWLSFVIIYEEKLMFNTRIVTLKDFLKCNELIPAFLTYGRLWGERDEEGGFLF